MSVIQEGKEIPWMKVKEREIRFVELAQCFTCDISFDPVRKVLLSHISNGRNCIWEIKEFALFCPNSTDISRRVAPIQRIWYSPILISLWHHFGKSGVKLRYRGIPSVSSQLSYSGWFHTLCLFMVPGSWESKAAFWSDHGPFTVLH